MGMNRKVIDIHNIFIINTDKMIYFTNRADRGLGSGQGRKRGDKRTWDTAAGAGTRRRSQRRAAESDG